MTILHDSVCTFNLCYSLYKLSHEYDIKKLLIFIYITKNTKRVPNRNISSHKIRILVRMI